MTGEEIVVYEDEAVSNLVDLIMETGGVFHYEMPEPQMDDAGNPVPMPPVRVPGMETDSKINKKKIFNK